MAVFEYTGFNLKGKSIKGVVDADSARSARAKLKKEGIIATELIVSEGALQEQKAKREFYLSDIFKRITSQDIAIFTRQLATLIGAGVPILESINAILEQLDNLKFKKILVAVKEKLSEGLSLADSLERTSKVFSPLYINMIRAGEASGALEVVLLRLAEYLEGQVKLRNRFISTMVYPVIMVVLATGVVAFLMIKVIPKVVVIFQDVNQALPVYTRILIFISHFMADYWYLLIGLAVLMVYAIRRYRKTPEGREKIDILMLKIPILGKIVKLRAVSRFSRTLATLLKSGIPLLQSLDIVKNIVNNVVLEKTIEDARDLISEGSSIAEPLRKTGVFPPMVIRMISVGEQSGELEAMLEKIADTTDNEIDTFVSALTSLLEPVIILLLAGMVLFIILSVLMPIFQINQIVR